MSHAIGKTRPSAPVALPPAVTAAEVSAAERHSDPRRWKGRVRASPGATPADGPPLAWEGGFAAVQAFLAAVRRRLTGEEGAAYGVSLLIHLVILAALAIPVIHHVTQAEPIIAAVVEESAGGGSAYGLPAMINTELAVPRTTAADPQSQFALPDLAADDTVAVSQALFGNPDGQGGQGTGSGAGFGAGDVGNGMMQFVPRNAVRAGSFAAWTTPIYNSSFPRPFGAPDPQPGDSPQPGQYYWITIQVKLPGERRRYSIRDLTGEVVGTDGYRQRIPEHTYLLTREGKLAPLHGKTTVPVIEGVVQFVVQVPGARLLVKDTIIIRSKLLKEEQTLELVFDGAGGRDVIENL